MDRSNVAKWIKYAIVTIMLSVGNANAAETSQENKKNIFNCTYSVGHDVYWTTVVTTMPENEINRQFAQYAKKNGSPYSGCAGNKSTDGKPYPSIEAAEASQARIFSNWKSALPRRIQWTPEEIRLEEIASKRNKKTINFRAPNHSLDEIGFQSVTFDIEYQLIACSGELHLAYSLVKNSVRGNKPAYLFQGPNEGSPSWHEVASAPPQVDAVHLKGEIYIPPFVHSNLIGKFSDAFAGESLGFGCFSGQTKKIANLKDHLGDNPTKEKVQAFIAKLSVSFETNDILRSQAAEAEIREGKAHQTNAPTERAANSTAGPTAEELRAQRHAEVEARNAAAMKKYQEDLAKQQQEVANFNAATDRVAAEKAAQAERARAAQAEFDRKRAAHAAEMERHRQQQAEYETLVAAPAKVKKPQ